MNRRSFFSTLVACLVAPFLNRNNNITFAPVKHADKIRGLKSDLVIYGDSFENIRALQLYSNDIISQQTMREIYENTNCGISNRVDSVSFIVTQSKR